MSKYDKMVGAEQFKETGDGYGYTYFENEAGVRVRRSDMTGEITEVSTGKILEAKGDGSLKYKYD